MAIQNDLPIIIIDDEENMLTTESLILEMHGFTNVHTLADSRQSQRLLQQYPNAIILLDITMPYLSGIDILSIIQSQFPECTTLMLTGLNDVEMVVKCIKMGAFDYIVKPINQTRLLTCISKALEHRLMQTESHRLAHSLLKHDLHHPENFEHIITHNDGMKDIFRYVEAIAPTHLPLLITGETGVGKELMAEAIHKSSCRKGKFQCVNIAGIDDTLLSDTLFGHDSGAFTSAQHSRKGLIELAEDGSLFLDEIGDLSPESQVKLLRLLQEGTYYRLGSETEMSSNARIITATNRSIDELQHSSNFRRDLFFRLRSHHIHIPPLRERSEDIGVLTDYFIKRVSHMLQKPTPRVPSEFYTILQNYSFPGNIRELEGIIQNAITRHKNGILSTNSIRTLMATSGADMIEKPTSEADTLTFSTPLPDYHQWESYLIHEAYNRAEGNKKLAAEMIGMARQTFRNKVKDYHIE